MEGKNYQDYKRVLKKYGYPLKEKGRILEAIKNLEALAAVIYEFHKGRKNKIKSEERKCEEKNG